ncbi:hypothetical protein W97_04004 [Coniosporium apollinis CBS 100218]|uniref:VOC domain-containing protein n=1 Tax=Coniosporium apollinis (strain CBS 100218) TaxID=1168221 RepID=R7YSY8_CONA1|nr:uncharacterized protein W97_04004 [Coniosporium apollinis CBS 100218]EON64771.1 hypothetical protein W97_04004 [Coniosporium apollinis CBS 100218]
MANHNQMIFLNLPVADLEASIAFYTALGFRQNTVFSSPDAAGMVISDSIWVMLHTPSSFASFLPAGRKATAAKTHTECLFCLSRPSREAVDEMVEKAGKAGGGVDVGFKKDEGYMYGRSFEDLDGHVWEVMWMAEEAPMDPEAAEEAKERGECGPGK